MPGGLPTLCPFQAPRLEPLHEEELTKGPDSVSPGEGQATGHWAKRRCSSNEGFNGACCLLGLCVIHMPISQAWPSPHPLSLAGAGFWLLLCDPVEITAPLWAGVHFICIPESWVWAVWAEAGGGSGGILQERGPVAGSRQ